MDICMKAGSILENCGNIWLTEGALSTQNILEKLVQISNEIKRDGIQNAVVV